ncbi:MAG: response regulator [Oscillospiraceae bacterium]|nr:response regulator [Oscillospiraceae bacterium]
MELKSLGLADDIGTILIVDDDMINRTILKKIFSDAYEVEERVNGREGLEALLNPNHTYCAVLLDMIMPEMTGIEVLQRLSPLGIPKQLPIFLITAETSDQLVRKAYDLGVMDVIRKPVVSFLVRRRVDSIIELFEARKSLNRVVKTQQLELLEQASQIIQLNRGMIEALATAIEFRNEESGGHVQRISKITTIILENTPFGEGLSAEEIDNISLASIMHDVGKITIPDAVLTKPGRFTPEEYEIMKTHTSKGVMILESIPQLRNSGIYDYACDIALHHHERWDGKGYPEGLKGDEISPWAQVVALADVYDALSCKRIYKKSYARQTVLDMICTGQCGVFNPRLLECFLPIEDQIFAIYQTLPEAQSD